MSLMSLAAVELIKPRSPQRSETDTLKQKV